MRGIGAEWKPQTSRPHIDKALHSALQAGQAQQASEDPRATPVGSTVTSKVTRIFVKKKKKKPSMSLLDGERQLMSPYK